MGVGTIETELLILYDNWPGWPVPVHDIPTDGFLGESHHNVAAAVYPVGTKIQVYNTGTVGQPGYATLIYLKYSATSAPTAVAKQVVVPDSATIWYTVTNDPDTNIALPTATAAFMLSVMTDAYYGWFWCGGIAPLDTTFWAGEASPVDGAVDTADGVEAGHFTAANNVGKDAISISPYATTNGYFGFAIAADTDT